MKVTDEAVEVLAETLARSASGRLWGQYTPGTRQLLIINSRPTARAALEAALPHLTDDGAVSPPADPTRVPPRTAAERATAKAAPSSPHLEGATPPPLEQVIRYLHEYQHGDRKCVQGNCHKRDTAARLAPAVRALFGDGATPATDREALAKAIDPDAFDETQHAWIQRPVRRMDALEAADRVLALIGGEPS